MSARCGDDVMQVFVFALDFSEDWIQRMLERAIEAVSLRRPELVKIRKNPVASLLVAFAVAPAEVFDHLFTGQHSLGDVVQHQKLALYHVIPVVPDATCAPGTPFLSQYLAHGTGEL